MLNSNLIGDKIALTGENKILSTNQLAWTGMVSIDDTALAVNDTGGYGIPILGSDFRHITFDERARGKKSKLSADYSFQTCVKDVDVILAARDIKHALVLGWSYGAFIAAHWASRNPDSCLGAVLVDGAQPYNWLNEKMETRIRRLFRWLSPIMWLLRSTGLTPRISAFQMAEINIELGRVASVNELAPVLDRLIIPTRYVLASGASFGSKSNELELIRTGVNAVVESNPNVKISAKVASSHDEILKKDFLAIANAVREVSSISHKKVTNKN
jgi:pimeloyl-ACP methyl ester carboxylesterase